MVWRAFPVSRWQLRWMNMHGLENYHFQIYKPWVILGLSGGIVMALQLWNQTSKKKQWIGGPTTNVYQLCCQDFSYHFLSCKPSTNWAVYFLRMGSLFFSKNQCLIPNHPIFGWIHLKKQSMGNVPSPRLLSMAPLMSVNLHCIW